MLRPDILKQIRFEKQFSKVVLFTPLNPLRVTDEIVVRLKNNMQQCCVYKRVSTYCKKPLL